MKKLYFIIILIASFNITDAQQKYTAGGYGQMYWDWRPDIADSCYEFTYINYRFTSEHAYDNTICSSITLYFWDDCNYGKNYINGYWPGNTYTNVPLHALLSPTTSTAVFDTFCGYPVIHNNIASAQRREPNRRKIIYKGLVYLPEKCKNWHFILGAYNNSCSIDFGCDAEWLVAKKASASYVNVLSNLDSIIFDTFTGQQEKGPHIVNGFYGCSFNNVDFPNNSSPRFLSTPIYSFQWKQNVECNPGLYDPDHDSMYVQIADTIRQTLRFRYAPMPTPFPIDGFSVTDWNGNPSPDVFLNKMYYAPVPGATGPNPQRYTPENPFDTDSTFLLDHQTGKTTFKANSIMEPALFYSVKDYRNDDFVSESYCVGQFTIMDDNRLPSYLRIDTASMKGAEFKSNGRIRVCAGYAASFDAWVKLPNDPSGDLIVQTTADTTLPGNGACTILNNHTDSVRLHFTWTPPPGTRGLYNVFVSAKDSNCNPPYHQFRQVYTWSFDVDTCQAPLKLTPNPSLEEAGITIYPNPASNKVTITSSKDFRTVNVYTLLSELVLEKKTKRCKELELDISSLPNGMYLVNVDGKYMRKMVVER